MHFKPLLKPGMIRSWLSVVLQSSHLCSTLSAARPTCALLLSVLPTVSESTVVFDHGPRTQPVPQFCMGSEAQILVHVSGVGVGSGAGVVEVHGSATAAAAKTARMAAESFIAAFDCESKRGRG